MNGSIETGQEQVQRQDNSRLTANSPRGALRPFGKLRAGRGSRTS